MSLELTIVLLFMQFLAMTRNSGQFLDLFIAVEAHIRTKKLEDIISEMSRSLVLVMKLL
ncbi:hypothetical protein KHA80_11935 [Anaerobacillus sp. HL2]|nr:hypothetical protein KHA80_11935 [Anaerobacillus sp. HL2]